MNKDYENRMRRLNMKRQFHAKLKSELRQGKEFAFALKAVEDVKLAAARENPQEAGQLNLAWAEYLKALKQVGMTK